MNFYITLNNGQHMPAIGLGTNRIKDVVNTVKKAIDVGYRLIDTASAYRNESEVGEAIKDKIKDGTIEREDIFVISKLWNTEHRPEKVVPAIKKSLSNLDLDYVDLYLIHFPFACKGDSDDVYKFDLPEDDVPFEDTWKCMEECVKLGYAKSIGVSNFNSVQITRLLNVAEIKPVVNEVECNLYCNQKKLLEFCKELGIAIIGYSPFWNGFVPQGGGPKIVSFLEDPIVKEIAQKHKKMEGQIALRYLIDLGTVPVPRTDSTQRLLQNFEALSFKLDAEDIERLDKLNKNLKRCVCPWAANFKEYPFAIEF